MRKWILRIVLGFVGLVVLVVGVGYMVPLDHTASRTATFGTPPSEVFAVITDFQGYPAWRPAVSRMEVTGPAGAGQLVREFGPTGEIPYRVEVLDPPSTLVMRIEPGLPFGGTWTYALEETPQGTSLTITEDGEVYNPVFRFMARFVFGYDATMNQYLEDLAGRLPPA